MMLIKVFNLADYSVNEYDAKRVYFKSRYFGYNIDCKQYRPSRFQCYNEFIIYTESKNEKFILKTKALFIIDRKECILVLNSDPIYE